MVFIEGFLVTSRWPVGGIKQQNFSFGKIASVFMQNFKIVYTFK